MSRRVFLLCVTLQRADNGGGGKGTINQSREASSLSDAGGRDGDDQERSCNETSLTIGNLNLCENDTKIEKLFP